jgi:Response regulator receiver domain
MWVRLATVVDRENDARCRASDAERSPGAPDRDKVLATVRALVACGTISGMRPTVLIVDDHAAFRASARALLQAEGFDVVGEAANGAGAVEAVAVLRPEIVLLDIQLPDLDGLAVAKQLAAAPDPPPQWCSSPAVTRQPMGPASKGHQHAGSSPGAGCPGRRSPP